MANFIEKTLEPDEQVIFKGHLHWYFNFRYTVWGVLLIILGIASMSYSAFAEPSAEAAGTASTASAPMWPLYLGIVICVVGLLSIFYGYFLRIKTEFAVTNTRFIQKDGIFDIHITEIPLFKVETVNFEQSFLDRIVNTGAIELVGSGGTNHKVAYIQQPYKVRNIITTTMKKGNDTSIPE